MTLIRLILASLIFLVACPTSWILAWQLGSWFTVMISIALPTYGLFYFLLSLYIENTFLHALLSMILGFAGAGVSLTLINILLQQNAEETSG